MPSLNKLYKMYRRRYSPVILIGVLVLFFFSASSSRADDFSNNFTENLNQTALDALAEDVGALMGAGTSQRGKVLGFPFGFDAGVMFPHIRVQEDNAILRDDSTLARATWFHAGVGLPGKFNVVGRLGSMESANMWSVGARYGIFDPELPGVPAWSLGAFYSDMGHDYFDLDTFTMNTVISIDLPFVEPYISGSYDKTEVNPTSRAFSGADPSISRDVTGKSDGYRIEGGVNLGLIPFTYFNLGVGLANGQEMYILGIGIDF